MQSITYRRKLAAGKAGASFFILILFILATQYLDHLSLSLMARTVVAIMLGVVILALFFVFLIEQLAPALAFWSPATTPADNFLRLDDAGLTYCRRGRERKWRWSELSEITRRWRRIAVTLPDDERVGALARWWGGLTSKGPRLSIRDDYVIPLEDLTAELNRHRAAATGTPAARDEERELGAEAASQAPFLIHHRQRFPVERIAAPVYMAVWILPLFMLGLILFFREPGFPRDALLLLIVGGILVLLVGALMGSTVFMAGTRGNCLSLGRKGLRYTRGGLSLAWPWHELSRFEIRKAAPETWPGRGSTARAISFTALGDRQAPSDGLEKVFKAAGPDSYAILDHYGTSLDEIAAKLNDYREQALASGVADGGQG